MLDCIDNLFQRIHQHDEFSRLLITTVTIVGTFWSMFFGLKLAYHTYQGFSIYLWAQLVHHDLKKKYGQWAVISGATDGIGLGFAKELASRGHSLIILGRNEEKLANVKSQLTEISQSPDEIVTIKIDLSNATIDDYKRTGDGMQIDERPIGILINNAGVFPGDIKRFHQQKLEDIRDSIGVNIMAATMLTRLTLPNMIKNGRGLIMNISSFTGEISAPFFSVYSPSKHFISNFSQVLQHEYCRFPIDIINYVTGPVLTKSMRELTDKFKQSSIISPHPDIYAKSALAAVSGSSKESSGYWSHGIMRAASLLAYNLGLWPLLMDIQARNNLLEPAPGRKIKQDARQFSNIRRGDRFWYENSNTPASFSLEQLNEIRKATQARLFCYNSDYLATIQPNVLRLPHPIYNGRVPCNQIPDVDLTPWQEDNDGGGGGFGGGNFPF